MTEPSDVPSRASGDTSTAPPELAVSRADRSAVLAAMHQLESALDHAADTGGSWCARVAETLDTLVAALETEHLHADEASGLWAELVAHAPRLDRRVQRLRSDMSDLRDELGSLAGELRHGSAPRPEQIDGIRLRLGDALARLRLLRAREVDLIHEAYVVDIGGGD